MPAFSKKKVLRPLSKVKMPTTDRRSNVFNDRDKKAFTSQSPLDPFPPFVTKNQLQELLFSMLFYMFTG
jgi:hypothetical protein